MYGKMKEFLAKELADIKAAGLYKNERIITTPQRADIKVNDGEDVLNFCANNYLGLSDNQRLINAAKEAMDTHGFGMSSVRFICGTQDLHKQLEAAISDYFKTEDTILYAACFDANGGLFEPLFTEEDAIISDALNHASIIDGVRLCKAKRYRYANADMADLERCLQEAQAQRHRIIATKSSKQLLYNRLLLLFYWIAFKSDYLITPSSLPTLINAAIALSKCAFSCPADNWTRIRACPFGTTG